MRMSDWSSDVCSSDLERLVNLALQGGGAHGAFTWGVLDRLLADERIEIEAISGTSAGAMNAVALAEGMMTGGPEEARACLKRFWRAVSDAGKGSLLPRPPLDMLLGNWNLDASPLHPMLHMLGPVPPPHHLPPL